MRRRRALQAGLGSGLTLALGCRSRPLELWIGGDVHLGVGGLARPLEPLGFLLGEALGVVNLEGPVREGVAGDERSGDAVRLANSSPRLGALAAAGVVAASVANNHALDFGEAGEADTVAAVRAAGLGAVGGSAGPCPIERRDLTPAVVVTSHDLSGPGVLLGIASELEEAARHGPLISLFHVTGPPSYLPSPLLSQAAEIALSLGARAVVSHGTHAVGPVERRGRQVVAWGLGNLLFACDCTDQRDGAILKLRLEGDETRATIIPVDAGLRGEPARPSHDAKLMFDLFASIGSSQLTASGESATF